MKAINIHGNEKNLEQNWEIIYPFIIKNEIDQSVLYCKNLTIEELEELEDKLIQELADTKENNIRNTISIILMDLKCNKSIDTIIKILNDKKNKNCATLIYALEGLDCSDRIIEIFHINLDGNYEAKCNLYRQLFGCFNNRKGRRCL